MSTEPEAPAPPVLRVERGSASAEDVAALAVVFAALSAEQESTPSSRRRAGWTNRRRTFNLGAVRGAGWGGGF